METDSQRRSESRTDGSAASCSQAEKRPLNNNILINAPLPYSVATGSNRWRDYWKLERRVTEQGPSWPRSGHLSLSASAVWRRGEDSASAETQLISSHYKSSTGWRALDRKLPSKELPHISHYINAPITGFFLQSWDSRLKRIFHLRKAVMMIYLSAVEWGGVPKAALHTQNISTHLCCMLYLDTHYAHLMPNV